MLLKNIDVCGRVFSILLSAIIVFFVEHTVLPPLFLTSSVYWEFHSSRYRRFAQASLESSVFADCEVHSHVYVRTCVLLTSHALVLKSSSKFYHFQRVSRDYYLTLWKSPTNVSNAQDVAFTRTLMPKWTSTAQDCSPTQRRVGGAFAYAIVIQPHKPPNVSSSGSTRSFSHTLWFPVETTPITATCH